MSNGTALYSTIATALACCLTAHTASAQTSDAPAPPVLAESSDLAQNDIVVTAQKRSESVLTIPLAVTAVDPDALTKQNLVRLQDFATRIPSLSVSGPNTTDIAIRGINAGGATSPTVAVTVDDVPFGSTSWAGNSTFPDLDPAEIERIEVLRGPQGTLYGAASLGGLIKYVTRDADPDDFSGRVSATGTTLTKGNEGYAVRASVNVPILRDMLGVRVSGYKRRESALFDRYVRRDGANVQGTLLARNIDRTDIEGFRVAAFFQPFERLTIKASHLEQDRTSLNDSSTVLKSFTDLTPKYAEFGTDNTGGRSTANVRLTQVVGELDLGAVSLVSVTGWGRSAAQDNTDVTNGFAFVFGGIPGFVGPIYPNAPAGSRVLLNDGSRLSKFSQEVRLASNGNGPLNWILGGFYTNERASLDQELFAADGNGDRLGLVVAFPLPSTFKEYAAFGDVTYAFTDRLKLQLGARYSRNDQAYRASQTVPDIAAAQTLFGSSRSGTLANSDDSSFTFVVGPQFQISEWVMAYARVASGYRPGGPNSAIAPQATFNPDRVVNYELGVKGRFFDRLLTLDAALFNIDWRDIQLGATTQAGVSYFTNGGKARSRGIEAAAQITPGDGWTVTGNVTVADAKLRQDLPAVTGLIGRRGDPLPNNAGFTSNVGFEKIWPVSGDLRFAVGGNYNHVGRRDTLYRSSAATIPVERRGKLRAPAYDLVDIRVSLRSDWWDLTAFVRNVFDERGIVSIGDGGGTNANPSASYIQPATFGVDLSFTF